MHNNVKGQWAWQKNIFARARTRIQHPLSLNPGYSPAPPLLPVFTCINTAVAIELDMKRFLSTTRVNQLAESSTATPPYLLSNIDLYYVGTHAS